MSCLKSCLYLSLLLGLISSITGSLLGSAGWAEGQYVLCRNQKTVRTIRVEDEPKDGICATKYTKNGLDQTVATSRSKASCVTILENIRSNLQKAAWSCKDISSATIYKETRESNEPQ